MRKLMTYWAIMMLLLCSGFVKEAHCQSAEDKTGNLTIPWDEFKGLLNLNEDQIVIPLETFQKLLAQAGITTAPPYSLQGGNVILTHAEFTNLVNRMKPPSQIAGTLPFDFLVTKAIYSGKIREDGSTFKGTFVVHVLKNGAYLKVPILPLGMALENITVDGEQTLVVSDNGYHNVILSGAGEYNVTVSFSLKSSFKEGPSKVNLSVLPIPITLLKLDIPIADLDVEIPQAQKIQTSSKGNTTTVTAVIAQGGTISINWRKKVAPADKLPPKIYAELHHLISIEDDALKVASDISLNILYSEIDELRLSIPDNMNVISVTGDGVGEWQETEGDDQHLLRVPFTYGKKGTVKLSVTLETGLTESVFANAFHGIHVLEAVRETGYIGIELNTSAEVVVAESDGLEPVAVQKLPPLLINKSTKPLMLGFKNLKHPYNLVLDIKKHQKVAVPTATINSANVVTLFTEDGKVVNRMIYNLRNNSKQFLEIQIPEGADIWSVFVDGKPVESSINAAGNMLVPLIRSTSTNNQLGTYPVEVIYCLVNDRFSWLATRGSSLPSVDVLVSQLMWSVYLPNDYSYHHFSSTLEVEEMIRAISILSSPERRYNEDEMKEISGLDLTDPDIQLVEKLKRAYKGEGYASNFKNIPMAEEAVVDQLNAELEFGGRMEVLARQDMPQGAMSGSNAIGVLPIQIRVPTSGQVYRFARTIIKPEDELSFEVTYTRSWVTATSKWILMLVLVVVLYLNRKLLLKPLRSCGKTAADIAHFYSKRRGSIEQAARSIMTPIVLLGLVVVSWPFSEAVSLFSLFLFWISSAFQVMEYRRKKAQIQTNVSGTRKEQEAR